MITTTGVQMHPGCGRCPTPKDIATGMCRVTRYAGAIWVPLAAHSLIVAEYALMVDGTRFLWACGLLHDAHETVTGEITRHYKPVEMKPLEKELDEEIFASFGFDYVRYQQNKDFIKQMDEKALTVEAETYGLKGWPAYYRSREGKDTPSLTGEERKVGENILRNWTAPSMIVSDSPHILRLTEALVAVKHKELTRARLFLGM